MKFAVSTIAISICLSYHSAFATLPIFAKSQTKASIYRVSIIKDGDSYKPVRTPLCTFTFDTNVYDLREQPSHIIQSESKICKTRIDGHDMNIFLNTYAAIDSEQLHNDESKLDVKSYTATLFLANTDNIDISFSKAPPVSTRSLDIHSHIPAILETSADSLGGCSTANPHGEPTCQDNVSIQATVEFERP